MQYTVQSFITDLEVAFPRFGKQDEVAARRWADLVQRKLASYPGQVLKDAAEDIITHRKAKSFPALADMISACDKWMPRKDPATAEREQVKAHQFSVIGQTLGEEFWNKCTAERPLRPIIATSLKENWHMCLKSFMVKHRRFPNDREAVACKAEAQMFLEAYEDCVRGGFPNAAELENLGDAMLKAREQERNRILGT